MIGLIGKKIGMSQIYDQGRVIPVSLIQAGPCPVIQIKNDQKDGYSALQLGFGTNKKLNKPLTGHLKKSKTESISRLFEFRIKDSSKYKIGDRINVSIFKDGEKVRVTGWTKGRGFSGGIKRWGWHGGPATHGSMSHRRIGSAGPGSSPGRVWKNKTMPGRYGNEKVTIRNIKIIKIEKDKNLLFLKGAVPGARNGYLLVTKDE